MRVALLLLPAALSGLVLAAHFLRRAQPLGVALGLALLPLMLVPRPWAARVLQVALLLAAAEWTRTLIGLAAERRAGGESWTRMAAILGGVAAVAVAGALLLESPALRRRFGRAPARVAPSGAGS